MTNGYVLGFGTATDIHFTQIYDDDGPGITPQEVLTLMAQLELGIKVSGGDLSRKRVVVRHSDLTGSTFFRVEAPLLRPRQSREL